PPARTGSPGFRPVREPTARRKTEAARFRTGCAETSATGCGEQAQFESGRLPAHVAKGLVSHPLNLRGRPADSEVMRRFGGPFRPDFIRPRRYTGWRSTSARYD